jgi:hypothetical protein
MRKFAVFTWLMLLLGGIVALFWRNEWVYRLPTPVPANYLPVQTGAAIQLAGLQKAGKPLFLHFYNPDCPCSRFNMPHFKTLVKQYAGEVDFAIVPMTGKNYPAKAIQEKFGLDIPVLSDTTIASACGVYSTPQAVIIDTNQQLYFRGNYNKSRYCTEKKTEYARMALDGLLHRNAAIIFDQFALKAYGCSLPKCTQP